MRRIAGMPDMAGWVVTVMSYLVTFVAFVICAGWTLKKKLKKNERRNEDNKSGHESRVMSYE